MIRRGSAQGILVAIAVGMVAASAALTMSSAAQELGHSGFHTIPPQDSGLPDGRDCLPGDADGSGTVGFPDFFLIYTHLCLGGGDPMTDCADSDGDCDIDAWDIYYLIAYIFLSGPAPVPPGCQNPPMVLDPEIPDTIQIAPDGISVEVGDRFGVPIYLSHDEGIGEIALDKILFDFGSDTDLLRCDSVTYWGTRLQNSPPLQTRTFTPSFPASSNQGYVYLGLSADAIVDTLPPGTGNIANLWFTALAEGEANIEYTHQDSVLTIPYPPNGYVEFYKCFQPVIEFGSITIVGTGGVNCEMSFTDPVFVATPAGSHPFVVSLRDASNDSIEGSMDVQVTITDHTGLEVCSTQVEFPVLSPLAPSDEHGRVRFYLAAGMCVPSCQAVVTSSCGEIATVPVRCVDADGDLHVLPLNDFTTDVNCTDFDGDGAIDSDDQNIFNLYLWQLCGDPCSAHRLSVSYQPEDSLTAGSLIDIQMRFENTTADPCSLIDVTFFSACFGAGSQDEEIISYALDKVVQPGRSYTKAMSEWEIPYCGLGCLSSVVTVADCGSPLLAKTCPQIMPQCRVDSLMCYPFRTWLAEDKYLFPDPPITLPPGFGITEEPTEGWYYANDTIRVTICHTEVSVIQDSVIYRFFLSDDEALDGSDDPYVNKVAVRGNNGDVTHDCQVDIDDPVYLICHIFDTCSAPEPIQIGNADCSSPETIDIDDVVHLINFIFSGGPPPEFCPELWQSRR